MSELVYCVRATLSGVRLDGEQFRPGWCVRAKEQVQSISQVPAVTPGRSQW